MNKKLYGLVWSHTAEFKILAFSAVTVNMLELDLFENVCIFLLVATSSSSNIERQMCSVVYPPGRLC